MPILLPCLNLLDETRQLPRHHRQQMMFPWLCHLRDFTDPELNEYEGLELVINQCCSIEQN